MSLANFIRSSKHLVAREKMLHMKAALEMKIAAASYGVQLQMTEPEIDNQGYDFTIALQYDILYIQNKSTISNANVNSWDFHPLHFQVPILERDLAPQVDGMSIGGIVGAMGGALVHRISHQAAVKGKLEVEYFYFDIFYASAVASGLWEPRSFSSHEAKSMMILIRDGEEGGRITIPLRAMLPIKSPSAILALRFGLPHPTNYVSIGRLPFEGGAPETFKELWRANVGQWVS